jgi:PAS domain-containing protein
MIDEIILFQSIFETAVEGILVIDDKGFIIKLNPSG